MYMYMYIYMFICIFTCIYIYMFICIYVYIYVFFIHGLKSDDLLLKTCFVQFIPNPHFS